MVSKKLTSQTTARRLGNEVSRCTPVQMAGVVASDREHSTHLLKQALVEDAHFNFAKIHLQMY